MVYLYDKWNITQLVVKYICDNICNRLPLHFIYFSFFHFHDARFQENKNFAKLRSNKFLYFINYRKLNRYWKYCEFYIFSNINNNSSDYSPNFMQSIFFLTFSLYRLSIFTQRGNQCRLGEILTSTGMISNVQKVFQFDSRNKLGK